MTHRQMKIETGGLYSRVENNDKETNSSRSDFRISMV